MPLVFRWNDWNRAHATRHGCTVAEIERVVRGYSNRKMGDDKRRVIGRGTGGRVVQVVFVYDPARVVYVLHAMPLEQ